MNSYRYLRIIKLNGGKNTFSNISFVTGVDDLFYSKSKSAAQQSLEADAIVGATAVLILAVNRRAWLGAA